MIAARVDMATDGQPAGDQKKKESLKEQLMKCPDACWKALTNCYKIKKNEPTKPGSSYKLPHSDMDQKSNPPETEPHRPNKLPDGQPPPTQPPEEQPPEVEVRCNEQV